MAENIPLLSEKDFVPLFIYTRNEEVKVLHYKQAAQAHKWLIETKWIHTGTIDPLTWIEVVLNEKKPIEFINSFKVKQK